MAIIQLQIRCILCLPCFSVHHFPVKYGHGMVFLCKLRFPGQLSVLPQFPPRLIGSYTSQCMLNRRTPQIGRKFWKMQVKIVPGLVLLCPVNQMLCLIKPFLCIRNFGKFTPGFRIHLNQITDCRAVDTQRMADGNILFSDFYTIAGCHLHTRPHSPF